MALVNTKKMLEKALAEGYAIPAFNICNMESAQAVAEVAAEKNVPVIISVSEGAGKYAGYDYIRAIVETASKKSSNDIALHLDHKRPYKTKETMEKNIGIRRETKRTGIIQTPHGIKKL